MDIIKAHYDRILLLLAGVTLLGASAYALLGVFSLSEQYSPPTSLGRGAPFQADPALAQLGAETPKLNDPGKFSWAEAVGKSLFVSRIYLLRDGKLVDILESDTELFPGIANKWIIEHELNYDDKNLATDDPDKDGFNNSEEFRAGTDPNEPASKPAVWTKLRVASSKIEKLRTKFEALPRGDLEVVQINTVSAEDPSALTGISKLYKIGDAIVLSETGPSGGQVETPTPLKFVAAKLVRSFNKSTNSEEEAPQITLESSLDGMKIELLRGEVKDSPYSLVTIQDTRIGGHTYELRSGQEFELEKGARYKLIDVSEETATIKDLASGEKHPIPRLETETSQQPSSAP